MLPAGVPVLVAALAAPAVLWVQGRRIAAREQKESAREYTGFDDAHTAKAGEGTGGEDPAGAHMASAHTAKEDAR